MRRPNSLFRRAQGSALADQMVAPQRPLPGFGARPQVVGTPQPLPGLISYGTQPPGFAQSSRFTGGTVPNPMSLTRGEPTPNFTPPSFGGAPPVGPVGPTPPTSPLLQALSPRGPMGAAPTGATSGPAPMGGGIVGSMLPPPPPPPPALVAAAQQIGLGSNPGGNPGHAILTPGGSGATSSAISAALAQLGIKLNPSRGNVHPYL